MGKKDYHNWPKEQLVHEVKQLLKRKKFGLVWEDKPEEVAEKCKEFLPVLKEDKKKKIITDKSGPVNILIEGDNYHSLSVLNYTHKKKIDVIYIDPPFNTGARDWKYNNNYVDVNDTYRHSKWLSMMLNRLKIAKNLLKDNGVLICAIDDNEFYRLGALLESIFPGREIHCITIVHNPRGIQGNNFSYTHEYAYFVFRKGLKIIGPRKIREEDIDWRNLRDNGGKSLRTDGKNCYYPIIIEDDKVIGFGDVVPNGIHPERQTVEDNNRYLVYPIDRKGIERKWRYARQSVEQVQHLLRANKTRSRFEIQIGKDFGTVRTVWQDSRYDANEYGTKLVHNLVPSAHFDFPKSVFNTYDCIASILYERKNAIVLDYFAGSGTTAHAVMMLNKEDSGNRKFIMCTNNENGIAEDVCYQRVKKVILGHKDYPDITGIPTNLQYFKTDFVGRVKTDNDKRVLVSRSTEMLCLAENTFDKILARKCAFALYQNKEQITGIIYDEDAIADFRKAIKKFKKPLVVYVFSYDHTYNEEDFADIPNLIKVKPIPEVILNVYKKIYKTLRKTKRL